MSRLERLPALESLSIEGYWITDGGMSRLSRIKSLTELELVRCGFVDEGFAHLANLGRLERLSLSRCKQITNRSLVHIKRLTTLRKLDVSATDVTEAGIAELRKAMPKTDVLGERVDQAGGGFF